MPVKRAFLFIPAFALHLLWSSPARGSCLAPSSCFCPNMEAVAVINGLVTEVGTPDQYKVRIRIQSITATTMKIPWSVGATITAARHANNNQPLGVGRRVLLPVFYDDFGMGQKPGDKTFEVSDMVVVDGDGKATCHLSHGFRLSAADVTRLMSLSVNSCNEEMVRLGVMDNATDCKDTSEVGCGPASVAGGTTPSHIPLGLLLLLTLALALRGATHATTKSGPGRSWRPALAASGKRPMEHSRSDFDLDLDLDLDLGQNDDLDNLDDLDQDAGANLDGAARSC